MWAHRGCGHAGRKMSLNGPPHGERTRSGGTKYVVHYMPVERENMLHRYVL